MIAESALPYQSNLAGVLLKVGTVGPHKCGPAGNQPGEQGDEESVYPARPGEAVPAFQPGRQSDSGRQPHPKDDGIAV